LLGVISMSVKRELEVREKLVRQPLELVGVRDIRKRYKILVDYEKKYGKYARCPHCGVELTYVYGEVIATYEYNVDDGYYLHFTNKTIEEVRYYCPMCNADISEEAVKFLFGRTLRGD